LRRTPAPKLDEVQFVHEEPGGASSNYNMKKLILSPRPDGVRSVHEAKGRSGQTLSTLRYNRGTKVANESLPVAKTKFFILRQFFAATLLLLPFAGKPGLDKSHPQGAAHLPGENIVEVRSGAWPINLERNADGVGTYSLIYRNQEVMNAVSLDTLTFSNLEQLRYFGKGLDALKVSPNGEIAQFKDYSIKRADKKFEGVWYLLRYQFGSTSFQQREADIMGKTIKGL
jgi:hypothetical protein